VDLDGDTPRRTKGQKTGVERLKEEGFGRCVTYCNEQTSSGSKLEGNRSKSKSGRPGVRYKGPTPKRKLGRRSLVGEVGERDTTVRRRSDWPGLPHVPKRVLARSSSRRRPGKVMMKGERDEKGWVGTAIDSTRRKGAGCIPLKGIYLNREEEIAELKKTNE